MNARFLSWSLLAVAAVAFIAAKPDVRNQDSPVAEDRASKVLATPPPRSPALREVVQMGPEEWRERFGMDLADVAPEIRDDILHLAGELQEMLAEGADPRGEDARGHAAAIRQLLADQGPDDR